MASARTMQTHLASGTGGGAGQGSGGQAGQIEAKRARNKLRKEERTGSVLPPPSQWSRGPIVYGHATALGGVGQTGYQAALPSSSYATSQTGAGYAAGTSYGTMGTAYGTTSGISAGKGAYGVGQTTSGRLQAKIEEAKEKSKERRERHRAKRRPDEIQQRNLVVDNEGVAHDSEYVQFRTATPVHLQRRQLAALNNPNDDDSASSSSSSESDRDSAFHSSPYTYQSTHRTTTTSSHPHHHHSSSLYPPTISAIPPYLADHSRTSIDAGPSSLSVPHAPDPSRRPSGSASLYNGASASSAAYDRIGPGYGSRVTSSKLRAVSTPVHQHPTTASYQPPAPAFNPNDPLRLPTLGTSTVSGGDASFNQESTARLSLGPDSTAGGAGQSGYDKAVKAGHASSSTRPPKMDGSAMGAGMHGLQRSFDAFKLDTRFAAHKVGKKISRKLNSVL
ncbi:hypothetical protein JCM10049v2_001731 [Rhodotorula toruloides]